MTITTTPADTATAPTPRVRGDSVDAVTFGATVVPFPAPAPAGALVQVVSGSYGAGHDAAAHHVAARLEAAGYSVEMLDVVDMFPVGLGRLLRAAYFRQLRAVPGTWSWLLRRLDGGGPLRRLVTAALAAAVGGHLGRAVAACGRRPELVVSTHPFASQALGHLRATGRLTTPVATYLTDMSVHPLWVHPGVDLHLALHEVPAAEARGRGAGRTVVVGPLAPGLPKASLAPLPDAQTGCPERAPGRCGLPVGAPLALVTGGSQGIGELEQAARDILATGLATPVVLCGENHGLESRLARVAGVVALGWRDDVPELMSVVDCVVQNAGGFTSLEALAAGVPTLSYRCLPGHGQTNAEALHDAGWVPWARTPRELAPLLRAALTAGRDGDHPAWDGRTRADVVEVLAELMPVRVLTLVPA